ncbi:Pol protein [Phytophthora palmivora]|uniref:Pol protein n=1 Tax=Phytophthora palmivora TaxID=4796 RepID=A0A2P4XSM4_9STRA|nr:Pol protein [Phytophthora palmivora]
MDEDVLEEFTKQILKNPEDSMYPLVEELSGVVSKHPPSQLPPDRGVRHDIDLVPFKWVAHYVKTCETCQRTLSVPADCRKSISRNFIFGLPADGTPVHKGNTGILMFSSRLNKMVHLAPVRDNVTGKQAAQLFLDSVFRYHDLSEAIVSDRDPCVTWAFWDTLFQLLKLI